MLFVVVCLLLLLFSVSISSSLSFFVACCLIFVFSRLEKKNNYSNKYFYRIKLHVRQQELKSLVQEIDKKEVNLGCIVDHVLV